MGCTTAGFGATVGGLHTLRDLGLIVTNGDVDEPPEPKTSLVEVPGSSNVLDLSCALTGRVEYGMRRLTLALAGEKAPGEWAPFMADLRRKLHGRRADIVLDSEPDLAYVGRVSVGELTRTGRAGTFKLEADCEPYRKETSPPDGNWLWDPFSFERGVIREYGDLSVEGELTVSIAGVENAVVPVITLTGVGEGASPYLVFEGKRHELHSGRNRVPEIRISQAGGSIELHGTFTASIDFRGGFI